MRPTGIGLERFPAGGVIAELHVKAFNIDRGLRM